MQTDKNVSWGMTSVQVVLVVDDDETILVVMARTLAEEGYAVHSAANGKDAFRLAEALHGRLRLVITDIRMPEMDGVALAGRLRQLNPPLPILFVSGYARPTIRPLPGPLLNKPFSPEDLLKQVEALIGPSAPGRALGQQLPNQAGQEP